MKRTLFLLLGLGLAACKVDMNNLLKRPRSGDSEAGYGSAPAPTPEEAAAHTARVGETATVQVDSDICKSDPARATQVTICEMVTVGPVAGVARIEPRAPGWCAQFSKDDLADYDVRAASTAMGFLVNDSSNWMYKSIRVLAPLCVNPTDAAVQQQTAYFYQYWSNETGGLSPEDIDDQLISLGTEERDAAALQKACTKFPESEDPYLQVIRDAVGCEGSSPAWSGGTGHSGLIDMMDAAPAAPPQLVRAYAVVGCLYNWPDIRDENLGPYAVCGVDARALDRKELDKQIASYPPIARFNARALFGRAQWTAGRYEAVARQKAAADADWQKLLFDAPAQGWKDWQAVYGEHGDTIEAMRAILRAPKAGCFEDSYRQLADHVKAAKPKNPEAVLHAMGDTLGALILSATAECAKLGSNDLWLAFSNLSGQTRIARGPRYAAYFAVLDALAASRSTRSDTLLDPAGMGNYFGRARGGSAIEQYDLALKDPGGQVKKISKSEGGFEIAFKTNRWKATEWICTPTSRVKFFGAGGEPVYEQDCKDGGEQWYEGSHGDVWIPAGWEDAIKPGTFVRSTYDHGSAFPVEVWANEKRTKLLAYLGIKL